jgi:hypothetical protein
MSKIPNNTAAQMEDSYPFWDHRFLHPEVLRFYVWLACYRGDHEMVRLLAERWPDKLIVILCILHLFGNYDLIDQLCMQDPENESVSGFMQRSNNSAPFNTYIRNKGISTSLHHSLPPTLAIINNMRQAANAVTLDHHPAYILACKDQWGDDVINLDIHDAFKSPAHRIAKALALDVNLPDNIFE